MKKQNKSAHLRIQPPDCAPAAESEIGRTSALIGGLHGFSDFPAISSLDLVCATHCTRHKDEIHSRFPEAAIAGGAGRVIEL